LIVAVVSIENLFPSLRFPMASSSSMKTMHPSGQLLACWKIYLTFLAPTPT
jgi:hypothetical protein